MAKSLYKRFFLARHAKSSSFLATLIIHALFVVVGLSVVVFRVAEKKDQAFAARKIDRPEMQMELKKLKVPVTIRKTKVPKPKARNTPVFRDDLKTVEVRLSDMAVTMGKWGLPDSYRGLDVPKLDIDINFFGIVGGGKHIVFILDCSPSMQGVREGIMRREAARIIEELTPGTDFAVIFFGGLAWAAGQKPDLNNWVQSAGSWQSFRPKDWNALPKVKYRKASYSTKSSMISEIRTTPLIEGTIYDCPVYMALSMDPIPDTIFFMTDGECDVERGIDSLRKMVDQLTAAGKRVPVMHTVGLEVYFSDQLEQMAELMGGECRFLTAREYDGKYGHDRSGHAPQNPGYDVTREVETVPADQYPVEFSLH
jgi:hypothetical protein